MFKIKTQHSATAALFEGILIGGSLVALSTFLFGTKKGKEFQKEILSKYKMLGSKAGGLKLEIEKALKSKTSKRKASGLKTKSRKAARKTRASSRKRTHRARA